MRRLRLSQVCVLLLPLFLLCLLAVPCAADEEGITWWPDIFKLFPGGDNQNDRDVSAPAYGATCLRGKRWPAWYGTGVTADKHWVAVDEHDGLATTSDWLSTDQERQVDVTDVYLAATWGTWEDVEGEAYRRQLAACGKYTPVTGYAEITVQVWRLNYPLDQYHCWRYKQDMYPPKYLDDIAVNIAEEADPPEEDWHTGWCMSGETWVMRYSESRYGAGPDPDIGYGTVLVVTGRNNNDGNMFYLDDVTVKYQRWQ